MIPFTSTISEWYLLRQRYLNDTFYVNNILMISFTSISFTSTISQWYLLRQRYLNGIFYVNDILMVSFTSTISKWYLLRQQYLNDIFYVNAIFTVHKHGNWQVHITSAWLITTKQPARLNCIHYLFILLCKYRRLLAYILQLDANSYILLR